MADHKNKYFYLKLRIFKNIFDVYLLKIWKNVFPWLKRNRLINDKYRPINLDIKRAFNKHLFRDKNEFLCSAPFKNLYFQPDGRIVSCCFNRTFTLGKYPEDSIPEIWKGEKLTKLRDYILYDDLSLGCNLCYEQMKAHNYDGVGAIYFDKYFMSKESPVMLEFELENTCNLECIMCNGNYSSSIRKNKEKRQPTQRMYDESFINKLSTIIPKLKYAKFLGGEPFLINIYYSIWAKIILTNPNCIIDVQTNGTIMTNRMKEILDKGNFRIGISLDSLNKETYQQIRVNAKFDTVMANISFFSLYAQKKR